jgi:GT2 family glycosyltransferase
MSGGPNTARPYVVVVVLNWNDYENAQACLQSLSDVAYPNMDVVVVDNGSTDGSGERIDREFDWCEVTFTGENLGFAGGNNVGIERAREKGADYVLLLNNDTVVESDFLAPLVEAAESEDHVALVSGVIRDESGELWYSGGSFWLDRCRIKRDDAIKDENEPYETEFVCGAMALVSSEFIEECEVFPESYFFAIEDMDISWQAKQGNWKVLVAPDAEIIHKVGASTDGERSPFRVYHETHGRLQFATGRLPIRERLRFLLFFVFSRPALYVKWYRMGASEWISANVRAILDFLRSRYPRGSMTG